MPTSPIDGHFPDRIPSAGWRLPGDGELTWLVESSDGSVRLRLAGVLDLATELSVPLAADDALAHRPCALVLDLGGVEFCDARGLSALLRLRRQVVESGTSVTFVGARPQLRRVFEVVGHGGLLMPPPDPSSGQPRS